MYIGNEGFAGSTRCFLLSSSIWLLCGSFLNGKIAFKKQYRNKCFARHLLLLLITILSQVYVMIEGEIVPIFLPLEKSVFSFS